MHPRQRLLLDNLIGNKGICFKIIENDNSVNLATKILYLERAINQDRDTFFRALDKVYQPELRGKDILVFVLALKTIHTLHFNHLIKNKSGSEKRALNQIFECITPDEISELKLSIYQIINQKIATLKKHDEEIPLRIQERKAEEKKITEQTSWRVKLNLPREQLVPNHMKYAIQSLEGVLTSEQYLLLPPSTQSLIAIRQNPTWQFIKEHGATFSQIQTLPAAELDQLFNHLFGIGQLIKRVHITLDDLLDLEPAVRIDLLEHWFNVVRLIQGEKLNLADLAALEFIVRAELFERTSDYLRLEEMGIPLNKLLTLNKLLRTELLNHPYKVATLLDKTPIESDSCLNSKQLRIGLFEHSAQEAYPSKQKKISFEQLSQLSVVALQEMLAHNEQANLLPETRIA